MSSNNQEKIQEAIPARFVMVSGSEDVQTSADVFNVGSFQLPDPAGKAGGACTSALLKVLNDNKGQPLSWIDLLHQMRSILQQKGFDQIPQLSSSRMLNVKEKFEIVPNQGGTKRAILIGINYEGQQGQLSGCHNDVNNIKRHLIKHEGFQEKDMLILMDDNVERKYHTPTRKNITDAFIKITQYSRTGDSVFIHYSGHGGRVRDTSGDEADGYDETLIPVDFRNAGQILDDDILDMLVKTMPAGVNVTVLMDCCHSGTAMDLPYIIEETETQMHSNSRFKAGKFGIEAAAGTAGCCGCLGCLMLDGAL